MKNMNKSIFTTLLFLTVSLQADSTNVHFMDGWIKQLPPVVPMRAGYVQINNLSEQTVEIVSMHSEQFEKVEMHETIMSEGMMKMVELNSLVIPAKSQIDLKPGGKHLMLISPETPMQIGDKVEMTVTFSDDKIQRIQFEVRK